MDISDDELIELKLKQEEKLERYLKRRNECTERTIEYLKLIYEELKKKKYIYIVLSKTI